MKKWTLLMATLFIAGASYACEGKCDKKNCCKKGAKKEGKACCKKKDGKDCAGGKHADKKSSVYYWGA